MDSQSGYYMLAFLARWQGEWVNGAQNKDHRAVPDRMIIIKEKEKQEASSCAVLGCRSCSQMGKRMYNGRMLLSLLCRQLVSVPFQPLFMIQAQSY